MTQTHPLFPNNVVRCATSAHSTVTAITLVMQTGLLIPPGYPEAIVEAVFKLLRDLVRRFHMGRAARAWVMEHYSEERVLGLTADYYRSLLDSDPVTQLQNA